MKSLSYQCSYPLIKVWFIVLPCGCHLNTPLLSFNVVILQDVAEEVVQIHKAMGAGIDVSFDCAGFNKTMSTALSATSAGGKVCLVGMGHSEMTVPLTPAAARYFDVITIKHFGLRNYAEIIRIS